MKTEKRGDFDIGRDKDALVLTKGKERIAMFVKSPGVEQSEINVAVSIGSGGILCYMLPFDDLLSILRNYRGLASQPKEK